MDIEEELEGYNLSELSNEALVRLMYNLTMEAEARIIYGGQQRKPLELTQEEKDKLPF